MSKPLNVLIITPESTIYDGEATLVQVPGTSGSFEVLHNHAPLLSTLNPGEVKVKTIYGEYKLFEIGSGIIEVKNNKVAILAEKV